MPPLSALTSAFTFPKPPSPSSTSFLARSSHNDIVMDYSPSLQLTKQGTYARTRARTHAHSASVLYIVENSRSSHYRALIHR